MESELFGYEKGAFSGAYSTKLGKFEIAGTGTLLLDEIGSLDPALQSKLLRAIEEKEFERVGGNTLIPLRARIVACTNSNLEQKMRDGEFREDLYYRLSIAEINIPPLRERPGGYSGAYRLLYRQGCAGYLFHAGGHASDAGL